MKKYFLFFGVGSFSLMSAMQSVSAEQKTYLCVQEYATGFYYTEGVGWHPTNFKADKKIILRPRKSGETNHTDHMSKNANYTYYAQLVGSQTPDYSCIVSTNGVFFKCDGFFGEIQMNANTLRYMENYFAGYVSQGTPDAPDNNNDTPALSIGTCSPL